MAGRGEQLLILGRGCTSQYLRDGLASISTTEVAREVLRQQRIARRTGHRFLRVDLVRFERTVDGNERGGKFHLRIRATQADRFFHPSVAVQIHGRIRALAAHVPVRGLLEEPVGLLVALDEIAEIEGRQGVAIVGSGARAQFQEQLLGDFWIALGVKRGAA